ncbi:MAG: hypothetical protein RSF86_13575 [Angelakisella sp.]
MTDILHRAVDYQEWNTLRTIRYEEGSFPTSSRTVLVYVRDVCTLTTSLTTTSRTRGSNFNP